MEMFPEFGVTGSPDPEASACAQLPAVICAASALTESVRAPAEAPEEETWASATPVQGSSVAMPSGYGPSRGKTTPGWGPDGRD